MKSKSGRQDQRFFGFLRRLRAGGRSNMYGAIPYLMSAFSLDREGAFRVVCDWLDLQAVAAENAQSSPGDTRVGARTSRRSAKGRAA